MGDLSASNSHRCPSRSSRICGFQRFLGFNCATRRNGPCRLAYRRIDDLPNMGHVITHEREKREQERERERERDRRSRHRPRVRGLAPAGSFSLSLFRFPPHVAIGTILIRESAKEEPFGLRQFSDVVYRLSLPPSTHGGGDARNAAKWSRNPTQGNATLYAVQNQGQRLGA